jgi:hypothetical protein
LPSTAGTTFDRELELAILSLPSEILAHEMVQQSLWNNNSGLIRGTLLAACASSSLTKYRYLISSSEI